MNCPHCNEKLKHEQYENIEIERCHDCRGVFLDSGELRKIVEDKSTKFSPQLIKSTVNGTKKGIPDAEVEKDVICPKCTAAMDPSNYNYESGIVIDFCGKCSGVWLDGTELEKVQVHRENWEKEAKKYQGDWEKLAKKSANTFDLDKEIENLNYGPTKYMIVKFFRKVAGLD